MQRPRKSWLAWLAAAVWLGWGLNGATVEAQGPDVSLSATITGPNEDGTYRVSGEVIPTVPPEELGIVKSTFFSVQLQAMAGAGSWPVHYAWWNHAYACFILVEATCLTDDEYYGVNVYSQSLYSEYLEEADGGKRFPFEVDVALPEGVTQLRVVAELEHSYSCAACYWDARNYVWSVHGPVSIDDISSGGLGDLIIPVVIGAGGLIGAGLAGAAVIKTLQGRKNGQEKEEEPEEYTLYVSAREGKTRLIADSRDAVYIYAQVRCDKPEVDTTALTQSIRFSPGGADGRRLAMSQPMMTGGYQAVTVQAQPQSEPVAGNATMTASAGGGPGHLTGVGGVQLADTPYFIKLY